MTLHAVTLTGEHGRGCSFSPCVESYTDHEDGISETTGIDEKRYIHLSPALISENDTHYGEEHDVLPDDNIRKTDKGDPVLAPMCERRGDTAR